MKHIGDVGSDLEHNGKGEAHQLDIGLYIKILLRNKWLIILSVIICLAGGYYVANKTKPVYSATAKVLADPYQPNADREEQYIASAMVFLFFETQYEIIRSRAIAESVVDKLDLVAYTRQKQAENTPTLNIVKEAKKYVKDLLRIETEKEVPLSDEELRQLLAEQIASNVKVSGGTRNQIITVSYEADNPKLAAEIINALADAYIEFGLTTRLNEVKNRQGWLTTQYEQLQKNLEESERRVQEYRENQGLIGSYEQRTMANNQLQNLNTSLVLAQTELSKLQEEVTFAREIRSGARDYSSIAQVMQNYAIESLAKDISTAQNKVDELFERYGEKHPKMIAARADLRSVKRNLEQEVAKVIDQIENEYQLAEMQVTNIKRLIQQTKSEVQNVQDENATLLSLEREVENNRRIYESFQSRLLEANVRGEINASNIHIIDRATIPKKPISPNVNKILVLSAMAGVVLGLALTLLRELSHNTFRTPDAVEEKLFIPVLGITPYVKDKNKAAPEKQYKDDSRSTFAESINTIRTGLIFSNIDKPPKTVLITSATGSEGKSTLALNLAYAYSQLGKTLLLEVDLRKPSLNKNLGRENSQGLTDIIAGTVTAFSDVIVTDNNGQLSILPCGTIPHNPMELLQSEKFETLLSGLKTKYSYIVLDGPPTLPVSDSCVIGSKVDGVIVAVRAEKTKIKVAKEAVARLKKLGSNVIGSVLTVAEPSKMSYYGDHYYAGEYYGTESKS